MIKTEFFISSCAKAIPRSRAAFDQAVFATEAERNRELQKRIDALTDYPPLNEAIFLEAGTIET